MMNEHKALHSRGVAEFMYNKAESMGLDKDQMFLVGLVHDVGYIYGPTGHAKKGGQLLYDAGFRFAPIVSWHDSTPQKYNQINLVEEPPKALLLLWMADLQVSSTGEIIGYDARLKDIESRYGSESTQYINAKNTIYYLREWEEEYL